MILVEKKVEFLFLPSSEGSLSFSLIHLDIHYQVYLHLLYLKHMTTLIQHCVQKPGERAVKMKTFLLISHSMLDR